MKLIGICGRKFHGKDTIGSYLVQTYGYCQFSFAQPLKEACRIIFGLSEEQLNGQDKEKLDEFWGVSARSILQYMGTDLLRNQIDRLIPWVGKDLWVNVMLRRLQDTEEEKIVITDVRFPNEATMIKNLGGLLIKVIRPAYKNLDNHASENFIDAIRADYEIINNGSLAELEEKVEALPIIF